MNCSAVNRCACAVSQGKLPAVPDPLPEFRGGGKQHVAGGVDRRFTGILNDADDEAHRHDLHGDIIIDAKHGAGHRDQQQGAAGHARSAAGAESGQDAQDDRADKGYADAQRMRRRQAGHPA